MIHHILLQHVSRVTFTRREARERVSCTISTVQQSKRDELLHFNRRRTFACHEQQKGVDCFIFKWRSGAHHRKIAESNDEPEPKRLRSAEPDLCVFIGAEKKEYQYHSQIMASHSSYIDTMLATPMRESQSSQISFPDLTPDLWEIMVKTLEPSEVRGLSIDHAQKLAPSYDKYSFESGLKICDQVLSEIFKQNQGRYRDVKPTRDLDCLIDSYLVANDTNLADTLKYGGKYFRGALRSISRYGRIIFSAEHLKKLAPVIVKRRLLDGILDEDALNPSEFLAIYRTGLLVYSIHRRISCIAQFKLSSQCGRTTLSPAVSTGKGHERFSRLLSVCDFQAPTAQLTGSLTWISTAQDIVYESDRKVKWGGVN